MGERSPACPINKIHASPREWPLTRAYHKTFRSARYLRELKHLNYQLLDGSSGLMSGMSLYKVFEDVVFCVVGINL